ncbi:hypothetical protein G7Z17_g119 [Cylindrodendrum hubeiense]|uniref:NACHT-NTPase and P-loop NTPases N-terminal domain-containing protein n=1 Tax=Cylindrodendrum hubeiense TaxID=595255 RepID=A0A9P5HT07_9HYPO|nr:hypothetical protein G7Z17_g119 [Cylindrodendrum hubeiense]
MPSAATKKTIKEIERRISSIETTIEKVNEVEQGTTLPQAFPVVAGYLPLVVKVLSSIVSHLKEKESAEETEDDKESYLEMKAAAEEWRSLVERLDDLFDTIPSEDSSAWVDRYREAVGSDDRLEEVMRALLSGIRDIAKVPLVNEDEIKDLQEALKVVKRLPPSLEDGGKTGQNFINNGPGIMPIHLGKGELNVNSGPGFMVTGKGAHSTVNYNGQKPPS